MEGHGSSPHNQETRPLLVSFTPSCLVQQKSGEEEEEKKAALRRRGSQHQELPSKGRDLTRPGLKPSQKKGHCWALHLVEKARASTMKASKSPLRQKPSCSMFFGFLVLFAHGALGQATSINTTTELAALAPSTVAGSISDPSPKATFRPTEFPTKKLKTMGKDGDAASEARPVSKSLTTTFSNKETTPVGTPSPEQLSTPKHSEPQTSTERRDPATLKQTKQTSTERRDPATLKQTKQADTTTDNHTSATQETATTVATTLNETETAKVAEKSQTTVGESTSFGTTAAPAGSTGLKPRSTKREKEKSTTPGQHVQGVPTAHETSSWGPETQYTTGASTIETAEDDTGVKEGPSKGSRGLTVAPGTPHSDSKTTASPAKGSKPVIVAIVLSILLLMVLLIAVLLCWRRRHSGSTSFKTAGWAGQVALPDDSGLDKEAEQGALATGEGEGRRATLTTFFGKRQSRVPSVAMEEVVQKETDGVEEAQPLIDGDASRVSSLGGSGEANGKLPEPTMQQSQEKEFPPPPANQEETPPTQPE